MSKFCFNESLHRTGMHNEMQLFSPPRNIQTFKLEQNKNNKIGKTNNKKSKLIEEINSETKIKLVSPKDRTTLNVGLQNIDH